VIDCSTWGSCSFWAWHPRPAPPLDLHALHRHRHRGICMCSRRSLAQPPGTRCWRQRAPPPASSRPSTAPAVCFVTSPLFAALTCCLVSRRRRDISNFSLVLVPTARLPALPPSTARLPALYLPPALYRDPPSSCRSQAYFACPSTQRIPSGSCRFGCPSKLTPA